MVEFLRTFRIANIEVRQADAPFSAGGKSYPAGTYVLGPSSFRPYVVDLIDEKKFPERRLYPGGPPDPPYDMTGYELSYQMGIKIDRVKEPFTLPAKFIDEIAAADRRSDRHCATTAFALSPASNWGVRAINRLLKSGARVSWAPDNRLIVAGRLARRCQQDGRRARRVLHRSRCGAGRSEADPRAAHRLVSQLSRQHGRGLDAVDARAIRVSVQDALECGSANRRSVAVRCAVVRG